MSLLDRIPSLKRSLPFLVVGLAQLTGLATARGEELLQNPGFENGSAGWGLFSPEPARGTFDISLKQPHSGKACAVLGSEETTRYALFPREATKVAAGKYQVKFWVKAAPEFKSFSSPGLVVRINLFDAERQETGWLMINLQGETIRGADLVVPARKPIPKEWTEVVLPFDVPEGVSSLKLHFFVWTGQGSLYVDDLSLSRAGQ